MKSGIKRFDKKAGNMKSCDGMYLYNETLLEEQFYKHFQAKFSLRGFGYLLWKSQVILQTFKVGTMVTSCSMQISVVT